MQAAGGCGKWDGEREGEENGVGVVGEAGEQVGSVLTAAMAGWLAALDRRIYRERSKENQIKPELLNRGLFSFCHGKARRRCPWFNPGICNSSQQLHKVTKNNY